MVQARDGAAFADALKEFVEEGPDPPPLARLYAYERYFVRAYPTKWMKPFDAAFAKEHLQAGRDWILRLKFDGDRHVLLYVRPSGRGPRRGGSGGSGKVIGFSLKAEPPDQPQRRPRVRRRRR